ncbi:hypothetical protein VTJ04DRAFT_3814 [Mycothermus thermophilus]|uniref:uncharacterized protein n=1 Tax=Humicola insolens TaxID=85995 RepID=UPI0037445161
MLGDTQGILGCRPFKPPTLNLHHHQKKKATRTPSQRSLKNPTSPLIYYSLITAFIASTAIAITSHYSGSRPTQAYYYTAQSQRS